MTLKKRYLRITHLLFIVLILIQFLPDRSTKDVFTGSLIAFAVGGQRSLRESYRAGAGKLPLCG